MMIGYNEALWTDPMVAVLKDCIAEYRNSQNRILVTRNVDRDTCN